MLYDRRDFWPAPLGRDLSMAPCGAAEKAFRIKNAPPGGGATVHPGAGQLCQER